jgi:(E)-4-hydroxy-3-methylbut-2-enyl-diphosphate synthase
MMERRASRRVRIGNRYIGGGEPVLVQSMTNTPTRDVEATLLQIRRLEEAGCEIVRCGVPDMESAMALGAILRGSRLPVVADIHFDAALAMEAVRQGVHKLRINPGNLRDRDEVRKLARACRKAGIPIRIGVNAGSLEPGLYQKHGGVCAAAMAESAMGEVRLLEECGFEEIVLSLKASSVGLTVESYRQVAGMCDYPFHVGITEAGTKNFGTVKSAAGIGILLYEGIGDTIRVSLTADPVAEVEAGWNILKALELRRRGPELISCPTCARAQIDVISLAGEVERRLSRLTYPIKVAVMGCAVNGPGEAREADVGVAGGKGMGVIFRGGEKVRVVEEWEMADALMEEVDRICRGGGQGEYVF